MTLQIFTIFRSINLHITSFCRWEYFHFILFSVTLQFYFIIKIKTESSLFHFYFIMVGRIFKYLHPITRFTAIDKENDFFNDLSISSFSIKSVKFTFNFKIVKMFCGIEKNNAKTKKKNKKIQSMIKRSYYLRISDRKSRIDYIRFEISQVNTSNSQMMNLGNMITNDDTIGFIQGFITLHDKNIAVYDAAVCHRQGKMRAHLTYKIDCRIYYGKRIIGEYDLLLQIVDTNFFKMIWPSSFSLKTMLIMIISKCGMNNDYRKMMKRKNVFNEKTMIAYIEAMKIELTFVLSTSDFEKSKKFTKHFMSNATEHSASKASQFVLKTSTSTLDQKSFVIFLRNIAIVNKTFSFDIFSEGNNQDGLILIMNGGHHENVKLFEAKRLLRHKRPRAPLGRHHV